jgi:hypothetical protein
VASDLDRTWAAVCAVESGDNALAWARGEDARGIAQIRAVMVADVNRYSATKFVHNDAWSVEKSEQIFRAYCLHYYPHGTPEQWARAWNGGPRGPSKKSTVGYWIKVKSAIK